MDRATVDKLLTTTRTVRRRLDLTRPVPSAIIEECLELAIQAPTGGGICRYHFLVLTDSAIKAQVATFYTKAQQPVLDQYAPRYSRGLLSGAQFLCEHLHEVPVLIFTGVEALPVENPDAPLWVYARLGSIYPATWSLMLALRSRGLASAWTNIHVTYEEELKTLLGTPASVSLAALIPVAYFTGDDFKPAKRIPARERTYWNGWGQTQR